MNNSINIYTDGGARGNPGPSAIGVYIEDSDKKRIAGFGKAIGHATNNTAEYRAVVEALEWVLENEKKLKLVRVNLYLDSSLVCNQINGIFKIKNSNLRNFLFEIRELESKINSSLYYTHVRRELNVEADKLVNHALDTSI